MTGTAAKVRVTVDLTERLNARLEKLVEITGNSSKADVIREALRLYECVAEHATEGYNICAVRGDSTVSLAGFIDVEVTKPRA